MPKLMRGPIDGGPSEVMISDQPINNFACSRAPATICIYSLLSSTQMVFSVFDPIKGNPHEVVRLQEETGNMNSGLSPDGKILAWREPHPIAVTFGQPTRELVLKNWNTFSSVD